MKNESKKVSKDYTPTPEEIDAILSSYALANPDNRLVARLYYEAIDAEGTLSGNALYASTPANPCLFKDRERLTNHTLRLVDKAKQVLGKNGITRCTVTLLRRNFSY